MIINADDFGYNASVNAAIIEAFRHGFCSSSTLMANMPGAEEAGALVRDHRLGGLVGMHLVLDEGEPLSEGVRKCPRFCGADGRLQFSRRRPTFRLDTSESTALAGEIRAQIERCRALGIEPTHLDSHHHVHTEWAVGTVVMAVAREEGITGVRLARNCGPGMRGPNRAYKFLYNRRLKKKGLARVEYFGSLEDYLYLIARKGTPRAALSSEIMIHLTYDADEVLTDDSVNPKPLTTSIQKVQQFREAVSYSGQPYREHAAT